MSCRQPSAAALAFASADFSPLSLLNCFAFNILTSFASCLLTNNALSQTLGADEVDGDVDSDTVARTVDVPTASCAPSR